MPLLQVPDRDLEYYLIACDADGNEREDDPHGLMSANIATALKSEGVTDVFILSHGWRGDLSAAQEQYDRWLSAMDDCTEDRERITQLRHRAEQKFRPLCVGVHWPSEPWGEEDFDDAFDFSAGDDVARRIDLWAGRIADSEAARGALTTIFAAAEYDLMPPTLPGEVREAYEVLNRESGLGASGPAGGPDADRNVFSAEIAYQDSFDAGVDFGGGFSLGGLLAPLKQLSFWQMKARARRLGEGCLHDWLTQLQGMDESEGMRFHFMGHSFGCIVVTSMISGPPGGAGPLRPADTAVLVQGALSHWSFCEDIPVEPGNAGYFRPFVDRRLVSGPLLVTTSRHDRALSFWYPKGAGVVGHVDFDPRQPPKYGALGVFGARGPGLNAETLKLKSVDDAYEFANGTVYILNGDEVIKDGGGFSGAHNDIAKPELAHAVWEGIMAAP